MNVAFDPWVPVVNAGGKRELASLCSVLAEGEKYIDLAVRPHERVALMRLLLCVAHAALDGPKDYDEWCDVPKRLPEAVRTYLETWRDAFDLFHPTKPWLQVAQLGLLPTDKGEEENEKGWSKLSKLCFTRASGNNSTLFDHASMDNTPPEIAAAEITLNLLTFQNYFVAGGKASSRLWGTVAMNNPPNPKGGPCSGKSVLFTFLRGKSLFESIQLNLNTYDELKYLYGDSGNWLGKPLWELPITSPTDEIAINNATRTHLGRLLPQTRILKLHEDRKRVLLGAGFVYPKFQDENNPFYPDAFATTVLNDSDEIQLLSAKPNVATWRQLHSMTVLSKGANEKSRGPLCLANVVVSRDCDIVVNAMITNPQQAAEILDLVDSVFHVSAKLRDEIGAATYAREVRYAQSMASRVGWALETYRLEIDGGWEGRLKGAGAKKGELKAKLHSVATPHYWTTVEKNLSLLMSHVDAIGGEQTEPTRDAWRRMLFRNACEAYTLACGQDTPRQRRAFAKGWQRLAATKDEPEMDGTEHKEDDQ